MYATLCKMTDEQVKLILDKRDEALLEAENHEDGVGAWGGQIGRG